MIIADDKNKRIRVFNPRQGTRGSIQGSGVQWTRRELSRPRGWGDSRGRHRASPDHTMTVSSDERVLEVRDMLCPICEVELRRTDVEGDGLVTIDVCPTCRGAWFDHTELTRLDDSIWANVERHAFRDTEGDHPNAVCPKCKEAMYDGRPMQFSLEPLSPADAPDLIVDRCPSCFGFWLDHGELERIVAIGDIYDELKQVERELNAKITRPERHLRWIIRVWSELPFTERAKIHSLVNDQVVQGAAKENALGLADYAQLPPELRLFVDIWFDLPEVQRARIMAMVKKARISEQERMLKEQSGVPTSTAADAKRSAVAGTERPEGWSWLRWAVFRFGSYLAESTSRE